jgi:Ca2+-binding EF-hand superfamily protein
VRKFLSRNGIEATDGEVQAIVKRLDTDRDSKISFTEFKRFFSLPLVDTGLSSSLTSSTLYSSKSSFRRFESPLRRPASPRRLLTPERGLGSPLRGITKSPVTSPVRTTVRSPVRSPIRSPVRVRSPLRSTLSPTIRSPLRTTLRSPVRSPLRETSFSKTSFLTYEEENFLSFLREIIASENDYERNRCDLILRSDFNVEDAFRIFELDGRGYLTDLDLKYGLNALDIFPTSEEINLLIKRFDLRNEGVLSYNNFYSIFNPLDREYSRMLELRLPSTYVSRYNRTDVFLPTTKLYLQNLLNAILRNEVRIEAWRQKLNGLVRFNTRLFFEKIDRLDKNYASDTDVYLINHR